MPIDDKRVASEGAGFGVIAGVIFLAAEMVDARSVGDPLRSAASVVLGRDALDSSLGTTFLIGLVVELAFAALFGLVYAVIEARLPEDARRRTGTQIAIGAAYASLVWLVSYDIVAMNLMPWLMPMTPLRHLVTQTLFYGAPLGWMFAAADRRVPRVIRPSVG